MMNDTTYSKAKVSGGHLRVGKAVPRIINLNLEDRRFTRWRKEKHPMWTEQHKKVSYGRPKQPSPLYTQHTAQGQPRRGQ